MVAQNWTPVLESWDRKKYDFGVNQASAAGADKPMARDAALWESLS